MGIYTDAHISEGRLRKCIREELTSGDAGTVSLLRSEIEKELRKEVTSGVETEASPLRDEIREAVREELTTGNANTSSLLKEEIRGELTSGDPNTPSLLSSEMEKELRKEVTSGDAAKSAPISHTESKFFVDSDGTTDWNKLTLAASATSATTTSLDTHEFGVKTISFHSDVAGTLTIDVETPDGTLLTYDEIDVSANTLESYIISAQVIAIKLTFGGFSGTPTITAWIVMKHI